MSGPTLPEILLPVPESSPLPFLNTGHCHSEHETMDRDFVVCPKSWPPAPHNMEVMVCQYDRFFGYGYWMTSIPTITHILIFCHILLGYCNIWIGCHGNQLENSEYPKNIKMWVMVRILVIHQPYPKSLSYWYTITSTLCVALWGFYRGWALHTMWR